MSNRARTLWLPALISMTGSMAWRLILQRAVVPSQTLLNHAGLPLSLYLLWLVLLPLLGAASACLSRRAGGSRSSRLTAALFPTIIMIPFWVALATVMSHPSPRQWLGAFCGVLYWIVVPGIALFLGAWPLSEIRFAQSEKKQISDLRVNARPVNTRPRTLWLPALVSLTAAMVFLTISTLVGSQPRFVAQGLATSVGYIPWVLTLPFCGAAGAYLSLRAGGKASTRLIAALFPVIALTALVGVLTLAGKFTYAKPHWMYFSIAFLLGVVLPGVSLLLGALPFVKTSKLLPS
jgi:hypothetical protein